MTDVEQQVKLIHDFQIEAVLIGGFAAFLHGASTLTRDLDICYARDDANLVRIVRALRSIDASLRGAPKELPFVLDEQTLKRGLNFTFETNIGAFDLFGEVPGVGNYPECLQNSDEAEILGSHYRILSLEKIIAAKETAGRPKDLLALPELKAILELRRRKNSS
jgi:hypothetical protein